MATETPQTTNQQTAPGIAGNGLNIAGCCAGLLLLAANLSACSADPGDDGTADGSVPPEDTEIEISPPTDADMRPYMESAFACTQRVDTGHALFHGCIDWHSAVHGHWAVLRHANLSTPGVEAAQIVADLRSAALEREREFMNASPGFEMPYGRAWFLALALEYDRLAGDDGLQAMAADMAASLRAFLETRAIDPLVREYGNHSWALIQLLRYYRSRGDIEGAKWVAARIEAHYLVYDAGAALAIDHSRPDFFSLWGNWALLLGLYDEGKLRDWLAQQQIPDDALRPIARANSAHQLGINPSRAWGLWWAYRATGESRFRQAIDAHRSQMRDTHASRGADYFAYGHWVPQFALYAITQPLE